MNSTAPSSAPKIKQGNWWRTLRPVLLWLALMLALVGYRQHRAMLERTCITFVTIAPTASPMYQTAAWLDGQPVVTGQKISLGSHTFKITHPKAETFETNFFAWYGERRIGLISLKRMTGSLNIHSDIPALTVLVTGPEFSTLLTNITESNLTVPTDDYAISADYPHRWVQKQKATVAAAQKAVCVLAPAFGSLHATANRDGETYELWDDNGHYIEGGNLPATVSVLAVGQYRLTAKWHSHAAEQQIAVKKGETSEAAMDFIFGAAILRTSPSGAAVLSVNGTQLGYTPLMVTEISPGPVEYRLKLDGYDDVSVALTVAANQTNDVTTNLMSLAYLSGMQKARNYISAAEYHGALDGVNQALEAKPGDPDATALLKTIQCRAAVLEAKNLASQGDYSGATLKLQTAFQAIPDDAEAKTLQTEYMTQMKEQTAAAKENQARALFDLDWKKVPCGPYFETQEYVTGRMTPEQTRDALVKSYAEQWPKAVVKINRVLRDGIYEVMFEQSATDQPARREMLVVFTKSKDGQTLILFRNFEYQRTVAGNYTPLNSNYIQMTADYEEQIRVGVHMMQRKIKVAIGETDKY